MRKRIESTAPSPCPSWVVDARRRVDITKGGDRHFHWRTRTPHLNPVIRAAAAAVLIALAASAAHAAFDVPTISAQSAAMGGSSIPGQGDSSMLFLNPAGSVGLTNPEAYMMYNQLYAGLSGVGSIGQGFGTVGIPTKVGVWGIGFADTQASGLLDERTIGISFARRWFDAVDAGVTAKYLYNRYLIGSDPLASADPVFSNGTSKGAFAFDAGLIAPFENGLKLGFAVRNINQPNIGLVTQDNVSRQVQAGLSYDIKPVALRVTADYAYTAAQTGTLIERSQPGIGLEKSFQDDHLKFRIGATLDQFSGGIGLQYGPFGLDYTFLMARTLTSNNAGTHMVGLRYKFGQGAPHAATASSEIAVPSLLALPPELGSNQQ